METAILILEDDISILRGLKDNLLFEGYQVETSTDGKAGLMLALDGSFDLVLLDLMLPGINGYEICRRLKKEKPDMPVIMITARGNEMDKIAGLDIGADDYMTKPFSIPELLARIRAVLRRSKPEKSNAESYTFGSVTIDFKKFRTRKNNQEVSLSSKEYAIMKYFIEHEGEVVHRDALLESVWGHEHIPDTRTVDNFILDLRKKLEDNPSKPEYIESIRGVGYRFSTEVGD